MKTRSSNRRSGEGVGTLASGVSITSSPPLPDDRKLSRKERKALANKLLDEIQASLPEHFPLPSAGKKKVTDWFRYKFKRKKVCRALLINKNGTMVPYYTCPSRKQFTIKGERYIWEQSASYYDTMNKVSTSVYYEGVPLPVRLFEEGKKLVFDTIDSSTYDEVQKMEYIKTLAQTGQISKILKNTFIVCVAILFITGVTLLVYLGKSGVLNFR